MTEAAASPQLHLFEAFGIEIEYMLVDQRSGAVAAIADRLLRDASGAVVADLERGRIAWSNELVLHVLEMKTNGPAPQLAGLLAAFSAEVSAANALLEPHGAVLMPGGMHPRLLPSQTQLWPYGQGEVYAAYDRIFGCSGHGWSNLQSVHLNLPFCGDDEFGRLHAAVRILLPLLPALAASSPLLEGRITGHLDTRLQVYAQNQARIAAITGAVVPEAVFSRADYERQILQPMYAAIAPFDPAGLLQEEWLNSRGAIARFDRHAIEIRVLDTQESVAADLAVVAAVVAVLRSLVRQEFVDYERQTSVATEPLAALLRAISRDAEATVVDDRAYLRLFGIEAPSMRAGELWRWLLERSPIDAGLEPEVHAALAVILREGTLARRILNRLDEDPQPAALAALERALCECIASGRSLSGSPSPIP